MASAPKRSRQKDGSATSRRGLRVAACGVSDVGLVREGNEDALLIDPAQGLFVVADGMGGHNCGEVASQFAVEAIAAFYDSADMTLRVRKAYKQMKAASPQSVRDVSHHGLRLRKAVESANVSVYRLSQQHEALRDMGTTVVACAVVGSRLYIANVGDSRLYRCRRGKLEQLTEDHSLVNEYLKMKMLRPEDVESFPYKNVIVRAVGLHERVSVDIYTATLRPGDQILLCSDGLSDLVRDADIEACLRASTSIQAASVALVDLAKARGGHDNITTLMLQAVGPEEAFVEPIYVRLPPMAADTLAAAVGPAPSSPPPAAPPSGPPPPPPPPGPAPISAPPTGPAPIAPSTPKG
jgi:serine/threonine protein phosphatase PrpC